MEEETRKTLPRHVGLIMDGNRRWAQCRGLSSKQGHMHGVKALRALVEAASGMGVEYLTVYGFSLDNWQRSVDETDYLMYLVRAYIRDDLANLHANHVRLKFIGKRLGVAEDILRMIDDAELLTQDNQGLCLAIAFNYGGRDEIVRALQSLIEKGEQTSLENIEKSLDSYPMPPVDLLIRTGGEQRLSDFLLWQSAYAELMFVETFWPDFTPACFKELLDAYRLRDRRFGANSPIETLEKTGQEKS